jgi:hypothetical protein
MKFKGVFLAAVLTAVICISGNVLAVLSGSGTSANPYLIQSRADFDEFANPDNAATYWASGVYTKLMCDPNLAGTTYTRAVIAPDTDSVTSDFQGTKLSGIFDGNGHKISNVVVNQPQSDYVGLFGYIGSGGQVKNLGVANISVNGYSHVGGLVGANSGTITSSYSAGSVSGYWLVGGLMGSNYDGGTVTSCYSDSSVSGSYYVGGLMGWNYYSTITSSYSTGSVSGSDYVGGLVGNNDANTAVITSCFWDIQTSGTSVGVGTGSAAGVTGKTTIEMKTKATFTSAGGDYTLSWFHSAEWSNNVPCAPYIAIIKSLSGDVVTSSPVLTPTTFGVWVPETMNMQLSPGTYTINFIPQGHRGLCWPVIDNVTLTSMASTSIIVNGGFEFPAFELNSTHSVAPTAWTLNLGAPYYETGATFNTTSGLWWNSYTHFPGAQEGQQYVGIGATPQMGISQSFSAGWDFNTPVWRMCEDGVNYPRLSWEFVKSGDFECPDGVGMEDLAVFIQQWLSVDCTSTNNFCGGTDLNADGKVDLVDYAIFADNWLAGI